VPVHLLRGAGPENGGGLDSTQGTKETGGVVYIAKKTRGGRRLRRARKRGEKKRFVLLNGKTERGWAQTQ